MSYLSDVVLGEGDESKSPYNVHPKPEWANSITVDEKYETKKRSIECSAIRVFVPIAQTLSKRLGEAPYTIYTLKVMSGVSEWTVQRRYSDFHYLHVQLSKFVKEQMPVLPPKRYIGSSTDPSFVEERRGLLEKYIRNVILMPSVWNRTEIIQFLDNNNNTLLFMWNFERMRRMQEMLSHMTFENKSQTEKLSSELQNARDEVAILKDRISQMEMLFLQQAMGVGSTVISPEKIRTLSGVVDKAQALNVAGSSFDAGSAVEHDHDQGSTIEGIDFDPKSLAGSSMEPSEILEVLKLSRKDIKTSEIRASSTDITERMISISKQIQDVVNMSNELLEEKIQFMAEPAATSDATSTQHSTSMSSNSSSLLPILQSGILEDYSTSDELALNAVLCASQDEIHSKSNWIGRLASRFDELICGLLPTNDCINQRLIVLSYIKDVVTRSLGALVFPIGSFVSRSFLPSGDIDITAFLSPGQDDSWFVKVNESLCICSMRDGVAQTGNNRIIVRNVTFVNAEVKVVKGIVNNIEVDISANQISALYAQGLIDSIDIFVGQNHLFKRSIIIVKAWCKYESIRHTASSQGGVFGARDGRLNTWTIIIMLIWVFNKYGAFIVHPLQALARFLVYYADFDWIKHALTVHGPVAAEDLSPLVDPEEFYAKPPQGGFISDDVLNSYRYRFEGTKEACELAAKERVKQQNGNSPEEINAYYAASENPYLMKYQTGLISHNYYKRGIVTVMDPIQVKSNAARSVDVAGVQAIQYAFRSGVHSLFRMCGKCESIFAASPPSPTSQPQAQDTLSADANLESEVDPISESNDELSVENSGSVNSSSLLEGNVLVHSGLLVKSSKTGARKYLHRDVPVVKSFMELTTAFIRETGRGSSVDFSVHTQGYSILNTSSIELELAMKHAELILGSIVTPQAIARIIVYIIENKGSLPVGEVGKLLQEYTGNDQLSVTLKSQFKGLKKIIEGYGGIFRLGGDHPFNPQVYLQEDFLHKMKYGTLSDYELEKYYTFDPTVVRGGVLSTPGSPTLSSSAGSIGSNNFRERDFIPLTKNTKAHSFRDQYHVSLEAKKEKRSESFGSAPLSQSLGHNYPPNIHIGEGIGSFGSSDYSPVASPSHASQQGQQYVDYNRKGKNSGRNSGNRGGGRGGLGIPHPRHQNFNPSQQGPGGHGQGQQYGGYQHGYVTTNQATGRSVMEEPPRLPLPPSSHSPHGNMQYVYMYQPQQVYPPQVPIVPPTGGANGSQLEGEGVMDNEGTNMDQRPPTAPVQVPVYQAPYMQGGYVGQPQPHQAAPQFVYYQTLVNGQPMMVSIPAAAYYSAVMQQQQELAALAAASSQQTEGGEIPVNSVEGATIPDAVTETN